MLHVHFDVNCELPKGRDYLSFYDSHAAATLHSNASSADTSGEVLSPENAALGIRVHTEDEGDGTLVGWKHDGVRTGDTSGGLSSNDFCRVKFDEGSKRSGWNVPMRRCVLLEAVHHGVECYVSGMSPIVGPRYTLPDRDYDLCEAEFLKLDPAERIPFVRIERPGDRWFADLPRTPKPLKDDDYLGDQVVQWSRKKRLFKFVFKQKICVPPFSPSDDPMMSRLVYLQAEHEVMVVGLLGFEDEATVAELAATRPTPQGKPKRPPKSHPFT